MKSELNWRTTFEGYRNGGAKKKNCTADLCVSVDKPSFFKISFIYLVVICGYITSLNVISYKQQQQQQLQHEIFGILKTVKKKQSVVC